MILVLTAALAAPTTFYIEYDGTHRRRVYDTLGPVADSHSDPKKSPQSAFVTVVGDWHATNRVLTLLHHSEDTIELRMYLQDDEHRGARVLRR